MAQMGIGYFNAKGQFFKTPEDATVSDLSRLLGQIGEGESLAPGIAHMLLERREDVERIFAEHDEMKKEETAQHERAVAGSDNVAVLPRRDAEHGKSG